ncbi:hypothetical protein [Tenacibaculum amylolyticum]
MNIFQPLKEVLTRLFQLSMPTTKVQAIPVYTRKNRNSLHKR